MIGIVFDTETVGCKTQTLLNVGYKIVDISIQNGTAEVLKQRDYVVGELIKNRLWLINDMFMGEEKLAKYDYLLQNKKIIQRSIKQIFKTLVNDIAKYKVLFGYAYNCDFDLDKFAKTAVQYGIENPFDKIPVFDIWAYAVNYICKSDNYITWAKANEVFTESGVYISTSVESVCKYLYGNLDFVENHTALSDCDHELNILLDCVRRGCDITRTQKMNGRFIPSEKVFKKTIIYKGEKIELEYTKQRGKDGAEIVKFD